jgi:tRNA A37 threonylcarbamoyladenosine dehydratase
VDGAFRVKLFRIIHGLDKKQQRHFHVTSKFQDDNHVDEIDKAGKHARVSVRMSERTQPVVAIVGVSTQADPTRAQISSIFTGAYKFPKKYLCFIKMYF